MSPVPFLTLDLSLRFERSLSLDVLACGAGKKRAELRERIYELSMILISSCCFGLLAVHRCTVPNPARGYAGNVQCSCNHVRVRARHFRNSCRDVRRSAGTSPRSCWEMPKPAGDVRPRFRDVQKAAGNVANRCHGTRTSAGDVRRSFRHSRTGDGNGTDACLDVIPGGQIVARLRRLRRDRWTRMNTNSSGFVLIRGYVISVRDRQRFLRSVDRPAAGPKTGAVSASHS